MNSCTKVIPRMSHRGMPVVVALIACVSCARSPVMTDHGMRESLDQRAREWVSSMKTLSGDRAKDLDVIQSFMEPCAFTEKTAIHWYPAIKQYYAEWETGIAKSVTIDQGGGMGTVAYKHVYRSPAGGVENLVVVTEWLRIDGVWYRSIEDFGWEKGSGERAGK